MYLTFPQVTSVPVPAVVPIVSGQLSGTVERIARVYVFGSSQFAAAAGFSAGRSAGFELALEPALAMLPLAAAGAPAVLGVVARSPPLAAGGAFAALGGAADAPPTAAGGMAAVPDIVERLPLSAAAGAPTVLCFGAVMAAGSTLADGEPSL